MAFANPQVVTIGGTAHSLRRINQDNGGAVFLKKAAGLEIKLSLRNTTEKVRPDGSMYERHNVELVYTTFDVNGVPTSHVVYMTCRNLRGADPVVPTNIIKALGVLADAQAASIVEGDVGP